VAVVPETKERPAYGRIEEIGFIENYTARTLEEVSSERRLGGERFQVRPKHQEPRDFESCRLPGVRMLAGNENSRRDGETIINVSGKPPVRAFVCTEPNPWRLPAKDRSGRLDQVEPPDLGKLLNKLVSKEKNA
jgi:hypothetical protein